MRKDSEKKSQVIDQMIIANKTYEIHDDGAIRPASRRPSFLKVRNMAYAIISIVALYLACAVLF